ncbi:hypothetical protein [Micromonospora sp. CPCC 206061]|uniref:hypothetical protein n=1 Tax=Micromonospora sp. CPCC 206061 TaxID=3122410 RepID=UPI002FF373BF
MTRRHAVPALCSTAFTMNGAPNSSVLDSGSFMLDPATMTVSNYLDGVSIQGSAADVKWLARVTPPTGTEFSIGSRYETAWQADANRAGLYVASSKRGCSPTPGWVVIKDLVRDSATGAVTSFAASYGLTCGNALAPNTGGLRYNSSVGYAAAAVNTTLLDFGAVEIGPDGAQKSVTVTATGSEPVTFAQARLLGTSANQHAVVDDRCVGKTLSPGQACSVTVQTNPTMKTQKAHTF